MDVRPHHRVVAVSAERRHPGKRFEEHAAERVDVDALVDRRQGADLLGGDVVNRPEKLPSRGESALRARVPRQPEVGEVTVVPAAPLSDENVGRLDIAVD
jgi:hypothetical protein